MYICIYVYVCICMYVFVCVVYRERERECKIPLYNLDSESNLDMRSILNPLYHTQSTLCATRQLSSLA